MAIKAVEMVRKIRDANYEKTKDLSRDERLQLLHEHAADFLQKLKKPKRAAARKKAKSATQAF